MANKAVEHQKTLEKLAQLIGQEQACALAVTPNDQRWVKELEDQKKKTSGEFMVLIVGIFSTGKSSMINALIGEKLLPSGLLPETGVLTELHYGEKKRITIYPKQGMYVSDEPFELPDATISTIRKYISLNSKDRKDQEKAFESPFEKMVIEWPLEILKEGIVLVDTVGLNDPYGNGAITERYLPQADAILYLLSCSNPPCTEMDRKELETLRDYGFNNIIFTYTHYDTALSAYMGDDEGLADMKRTNAAFCGDHTDLGADSIHYVNSLEGLAAAIERDEEKRRHSGYADLEAFMESYLVENKGREQVDVLTRVMRAKRDDMARSAAAQDAAAKSDREEALKKAEAAEKELENIRKRSHATARTFRMLLTGCYPELEKLVADHMKQVAQTVSLDDYAIQTQLPTGFGKLLPFAQKRKADELMTECKTAFDEEIKKANTRWLRETLQPAIQKKVEQSIRAIEQDVRDIAMDLKGVEDVLTENMADKKGNGTAGEVAGNIALGLVYGVLTGDFISATQIGVYGMKRFGIVFATEIGVGVLLGILGAPLTLPVLVASVIVADIVGLLVGGGKSMIASIKKKAIKEMRALYADPENYRKNCDNIMDRLREIIEGICDTMDEALEADITAHEKLINEAVAAANSSAEEKTAGIARRAGAIADLDRLMDDMNQVRGDYGLATI